MLRLRMRWLAAILCLGLVAAACGDDDGGDSTDDGGGAETTQPAGDDGGDAAAGDDGATETTAAPAGEPVVGGEVTMLLEGETDTWDIPNAACAVACITVMRQVAEPLFVEDDAGVAQPYLLASAESNEDFTEWTLTMRDGITFHDGTAADGAALLTNIESMAAGATVGQQYRDMTSVELVDDMTVTLTFSIPTSNLPNALAERGGYLLAPAFWADPELRSTQPIGTGPFRWESWVPDESVVLVRNEDYWRTDDQGRPLPYLDKITFRPVPDVSARRATMESGDADLNHDSFAENSEFWTTEWEGGYLDDPSNQETSYLLLNSAAPPFDDPDARRALALCSDRDEYIALRSPGNARADGPFAEGTLGYIEDTGFPQFDPEAGRALAEEVGLTNVVYGVQDVPSNLVTAQLWADMWNRNCGIEVTIDPFDQSELITRAITGDFQVFQWRNHSEINPAQEYVWWHSRHAEGLALNFGRIRNDGIDAALDAIRATDDPAEQDALAQEINRIFGEQVYNIWLNYTSWIVPYRAGVNGVGVLHLPDGGMAQPMRAGRVWLHEVWVDPA